MRDTRELTEIALFAGLGLILDFISGLLSGMVWAFGGSISLGVLPIFIVSFRRGTGAGLLTGLIVGMLQIILGDTYIVHPAQFLLDYAFAYMIVGIAGVVHKKINILTIIIGVVIGMSARFIMHFLSGVIYFAEYAGDQHVVIYSFVYNLSYLLPTLVIVIFILITIYSTNKSVFKVEA